MALKLIPRDDPSPATWRKVIAVASGKGGVGKTWFAISLSQALSQAGSRTLLFGGDLGLANVDIQLGLMPERDLSSVIAGKLTLPQAVTKYDKGAFDIVAGRSGAGNLAALPIQRLTGLRDSLMRLADRYDRVVMDLGAGVDRTVLTTHRERRNNLDHHHGRTDLVDRCLCVYQIDRRRSARRGYAHRCQHVRFSKQRTRNL